MISRTIAAIQRRQGKWSDSTASCRKAVSVDPKDRSGSRMGWNLVSGGAGGEALKNSLGSREVTKKRCALRALWQLAALLLLFLSAPLAGAEWRVISTETQGKGAAGVVHLVTQAEDVATGDKATLHLAVLPTKTATLRVIDDAEDAHGDLAETMVREKCIAGVNGGYFDPQYAPVGLLISDGRIVAPQRKARLLSGVVSAANGRVQIQRAAEFSAKIKPMAARQCGPFLLERGTAIAGLNNTRAARRTFVATGGADRAAIGYCSYVTLAQLGSLLATPGVAADLKIQRALNLDGGSSSGFWFTDGSKPFSVSEQKTVRDYLAIVPRP